MANRDQARRLRIIELLGVPIGTANARLLKALLFDLAKRLSLTRCFRCGGEIETVGTFSIEHKAAWEHSLAPRDLFFDLDNISFSHRACNYRAAAKPNKKYASRAEKDRAKDERVAADPIRRERKETVRKLWRQACREKTNGRGSRPTR